MTIRAIAIALGILSTIACVPTSLPKSPPRPYSGSLPPHVQLNLAGTFTLSPTGDLMLALDEPCTEGSRDIPSMRCGGTVLSAIHVVAQMPWGTQVRGIWLDEEHLVFRVDWKFSGLDPHNADVAQLIAQPWTISATPWIPSTDEVTWMPSTDEVRQILTLLGALVEPEIISGGPPPNLEITRFEVDGGALRAGSATTLTVQITNRGPGTAYRVAATVRSGIMGLHGRRAEFGRIPPGTEKLRWLRLTLPASEASPDTMLVLVFEEGNGFSPPSASRRVPIAAPAVAPVLAVQCSIPGRSNERPGLDAGEQIVVRCVVDNTGTGAANVVLQTSLGRAKPISSLARPVAPRSRISFDIPMAVPRDLAIDSTVEIAIVAFDREFARAARTRIVGVIRKPRLCATGELTHTQYQAKLAGLRAARAAGDLTQDQFDRYDAELVSCLNDAP